MKQATLARRYLFKLLANMASVPVYLVMEAVLPRALGPQMYGNFSFATSVFQQLSGFLDMGTSTCFYNALSRRQREGGLVSFYARAMALVLAVMLVVGLALLYPPLGELALPGVPLWMAPFAALWGFLFWWSRVLRSMNDAIGATVRSELARTVCSLAGVLVLLGLFASGTLTPWTLFIQQYALMGGTALGFWLVMRGFWGPLPWRLPAADIRAYRREFFDYSHPLLVQALLSFLLLTAERWLLQWFDGSAEQGFYALSQKVSMACVLFVAAMTPLIMRELSIAWGQEDKAAMGRLLTRFAPMLYVVAAYFSCFTVAEGDVLVRIFGGAAFAAAMVPVQIMALYPVHQTCGQLAGSVFHATGRTSTLRNVTALECVYGFATAWVMLAPAEYGGLHLGAVGLALKTVVVQCVTANLCLWLASRLVPFAFWRNLAHQVWSVGLLLALAWGCRTLTLALGLGDTTSLARFLVSGLLYSLLTATLCWLFPPLIGSTAQDLYEWRVRVQGGLTAAWRSLRGG